MHYVFEQTRFQNIFNRAYVTFHRYFWIILPMLVIPIILGEQIDWPLIKIFAGFACAGVIAVSLYFYLLNLGTKVSVEYRLEISDEGISYNRYELVKRIRWDDFASVSVKNRWPRMISLHSKNARPIEFSYYTFSSEQRRELLSVLASKASQ
ncbi:MAG: hypothetical protein GJ680_01150 [Alteromonadaceae bacterium]|nr:hypothetical protein [Alteromonadaceae bacterium]